MEIHQTRVEAKVSSVFSIGTPIIIAVENMMKVFIVNRRKDAMSPQGTNAPQGQNIG